MSGGDIFKKRMIMVLGARSAGKSSLVLQYVESHYVDKYYPTIENSYTKTVKHAGAEFECHIPDTAGQDEFSILNVRHTISIHGYVFVYSIVSRASFDMVKNLHAKIIEFTSLQSVPAVIIGQKSDLTHPSEGQELAKEFSCAYVETSARDNCNVFKLCLAEIEKRYRRQGTQAPPAPNPGCILA